MCPATPSSKPCLANTLKAAAKCCFLYSSSSLALVNFGGDRMEMFPSLSPRKWTSSKNESSFFVGGGPLTFWFRGFKVDCWSTSVRVAPGAMVLMVLCDASLMMGLLLRLIRLGMRAACLSSIFIFDLPSDPYKLPKGYSHVTLDQSSATISLPPTCILDPTGGVLRKRRDGIRPRMCGVTGRDGGFRLL